MLAEPNSSSGRQDVTGKPLDVLTLLRWSFDRLPNDNHKYAAHDGPNLRLKMLHMQQALLQVHQVLPIGLMMPVRSQKRSCLQVRNSGLVLLAGTSSWMQRFSCAATLRSTCWKSGLAF
jgi:hypothetical protein